MPSVPMAESETEGLHVQLRYGSQWRPVWIAPAPAALKSLAYLVHNWMLLVSNMEISMAAKTATSRIQLIGLAPIEIGIAAGT